MKRVGSLQLSLVGGDDASRSIRSLLQGLDPEVSSNLLDGFREGFLSRIVLLMNGGGLFRTEPVDLPAGGAGEIHCLGILPDQGYLELVSAIADHGNSDITFGAHGWPILSSRVAASTIAEGGGESIPAAGGGA